MMKRKLLLVLILAAVLTFGAVLTAYAVSGASFTTFNPSVDGSGRDVCKNSIINCNIYGAKEYVWLNGGPTANGLGPDGEYFFAVLEPGGQPNPNDQGGVPDRNLSDDFDDYTNRIFTVTDGEVFAYDGDHWFDSNTQAPDGCKKNGKNACDGPDGLPPFIRLFPYSDTTNPGGVYIMAICSLADGVPVKPRDCKYDAFKVKEGRMTYDIFLSGYKIHDLEADGSWNNNDYGLSGWTINITGFGFLGEEINESLLTGDGGYWEWGKNYVFTGKDKPVTAELTVCEDLQADWDQSAPESVCYDLTLEPSALAQELNLNFLNYMPVDIKACKFTDDYDATTPPTPYVGWPVYLIVDGNETGPFLTGDDGCYYWDDLDPGYTYAVREDDPLEWVPLNGDTVDFGYVISGDGPFEATFVNVPAQGCTPGFWQGGPDKPDAKAGGSLLWDGSDVMPWGEVILPPPHVDAQWTASGGQGGNPYIHGDDFHAFFGGYNPGAYTMFELVDTGGGSENWRKAARSLVAAYLNASWGMNYAYTTAELAQMWTDASSSADFLALHTLLDDANNHFGNPAGDCPISAGGF